MDIAIRTYHPPIHNTGTVLRLLLRLDSINEPGLTHAEFRALFSICRHCDVVMTRRIFLVHECPVEIVDEVIDLTSDDE
jgi:hypothetical protein